MNSLFIIKKPILKHNPEKKNKCIISVYSKDGEIYSSTYNYFNR